ncbi:hypothetical protein ACFC26_24005 [Kitasatospora purpeofusca]|uniref:Restriction endonuclease n=1 Tax=Kitasatospora purpeofusca TaxID=67352 RepID=A0ABZ1U0B7_9ACTN|nr:hypothetical protein [Kitasatospora purpeofusca]MCX4757198.1 hypothetical protein [Kitasatospora purpeofusca]WSR35043.1 hypothetical protein OG715_31275 [Kitasatospora purpeofusca]WSR43366.1 hypothetical protein OG196_32320 [Kitasatospora purpeofusca]
MPVNEDSGEGGSRDDALFQRLVGEVCVNVYRFGGMGVVDFGETVSWPLGESGEVSTGSRFAVHAQCPFRIVQHGKIFLGSDDLVPARRGDPSEGEDQRLQYDTGADVLREFLNRKAPRVLTVERAPEGDIRIALEHGIRIDVLPTSSKPEESWRFMVRLGEHVTFPPTD